MNYGYDIINLLETYIELIDEILPSFEKYDRTEHYEICNKVYKLYEDIIQTEQVNYKERVRVDIPNKLIRRFVSKTLSYPFMCVYVFLYPRYNSLLYYELETYLFEELNTDYNGDLIKLCAYKMYEMRRSIRFSLNYLKEGDTIINACNNKSDEIFDVLVYDNFLVNELGDFKLNLSLLSDTVEEFKNTNQNIIDCIEVTNVVTIYYSDIYQDNSFDNNIDTDFNLALNILKKFDRELVKSILNKEVISDLDGIMDDIMFNIEYDIKQYNQDVPKYQISAKVADAFLYLVNVIFTFDSQDCIMTKIMYLLETEEDEITFKDAVAEVYNAIEDSSYQTPVYQLSNFIETFNVSLYLQRSFNKTFEEII